MTSRYQVAGLNAWCTHRLIKGLVLPQLTYGIEIWEHKAMITEAQVALNKVVRTAYRIGLKVPTLAIHTEKGVPPLDLLALGRHNTLALRAKFVGRDTNMTRRWLQNSGIAPVIDNATDQNTGKETSAKKPFSPDISSPRPDETSPLFAPRPSGSPEPSLPFISCIWCARRPHFPSKASDALLAPPPPPSTFLLYPPPYLLVYRPPAYSYQLRAFGGPPRSPLTSSDLDLSTPVR